MSGQSRGCEKVIVLKYLGSQNDWENDCDRDRDLSDSKILFRIANHNSAMIGIEIESFSRSTNALRSIAKLLLIRIFLSD